MNFSKKGTINKEKEIKSTTKRLASKGRVQLFRIAIVTILALLIIGSFAAYGVFKSIIDQAPDINDIGLTPTGYTTIVYDKNGNVIENLIGSEANRVYVTLDKIPLDLQHAFIAIEDERFYEHDGIDVRGIFRAGFKTLLNGRLGQGASTLTQQLLKNQVFGGGSESDNYDKIKRKIQEQYLAIQTEDRYSKDEILELYLNTINCGSGTFGVQTASQKYFGKDVSDLTLSEATVIAVITNSPVNNNPITYPEKNAKRRQACLDKMLELGFITQKQYDKALADDVYDRIKTYNEENDTSSYYSYFVDALIDQVIRDLVDINGYSESEATNLVYSGGLSIYTTQDSKVQKIVDDVYSDESFFPELGKNAFYELTYALSIQYANGDTKHYHTNDLEKFYANDSSFNILFTDKEAMQKKIDAFKASVYDESKDLLLDEKVTMTIQPQSSFVVMEQKTGYVSAIIGGRGDKTGNRTLNRATTSTRQPGSTFKILSTYLPALDTAGMTLATVFDDAPYNYPGTSTPVNNWETNTYKGLTTLREAIYNSMNVVTVKTLEQVTPQVGYDYLKKLGFTTLVDNKIANDGKVYTDIALPLALGGITDGVTNLELTAAYAAIANHGSYNKPTFYTTILDHDGKVLLDKSKPHSEQVMKESTAWLLTSAMQDVVKIGTGQAAAFKNISMPVAGKTGTTSNYLDTWFSGFTPYYTASIWSGYDKNNRNQTDKTYHKNVWREIMERIHEQKKLETKDFEKPDSIISAKICKKSGMLATTDCEHALGGSTVRTEYFAKGTLPSDKCDVHVKVRICKASGLIATDYCPEDDIEEVVYLVKDETSPTRDTPFLLPTKECNIHTSPQTVEDTEEELPGMDDNPLRPEQKPAVDSNNQQNNEWGNRPSNKPNKPQTPPVTTEPPSTPQITPPPNIEDNWSEDEDDALNEEDDVSPPPTPSVEPDHQQEPEDIPEDNSEIAE